MGFFLWEGREILFQLGIFAQMKISPEKFHFLEP